MDVLIISPDRSVRHSISRILQDAGFTCVSVSDSHLWLSQLITSPDCRLVITANTFGGGQPSGIDVLRRIRMMPQYADLPVVVMSGLPGSIQKEVEDNNGILLPTPFERGALLVLVHQLIRP